MDRMTSKIHAVEDANGLPIHVALTPGEAHDNRLCSILLSALLPQTMLLGDRGYDADWIRELSRPQGASANIPQKTKSQRPDLLWPVSVSRAELGCALRVHSLKFVESFIVLFTLNQEPVH